MVTLKHAALKCTTTTKMLLHNNILMHYGWISVSLLHIILLAYRHFAHRGFKLSAPLADNAPPLLRAPSKPPV